jgi:hypothetical protein
MSSKFGNIETEIAGVASVESDSLGGFKAMDQDVYPFRIKMAYHKVSSGGANALSLIMHNPKLDVTLMEDIYFTSGTKKGAKNTFTKDGVTNYLPGYNQVTSLAQLLLGVPFDTNLEMASKTIKLYNREAGGEVNTSVDAFIDFMGKDVLVAVARIRENKQIKGTKPDGTQGYINDPSGADRMKNEIVKFFCPSTHRTYAEVVAKSEPAFMDSWKAKNAGPDKMNDKYVKVDSSATPGVPGATTGSAAAAVTPANLFDA